MQVRGGHQELRGCEGGMLRALQLCSCAADLHLRLLGAPGAHAHGGFLLLMQVLGGH